MTTIAWDNTEIAWDSQQTSGTDIKWIDREKVRAKDGKVYALAGDPRMFNALIAWEKTGADPEMYPGNDTDVFVVFFKEDVHIYVLGYALTRMRDVYAIGTGGDLAIAAMRAGLTPTAAVTLVADMDIYTGGPINSLMFTNVFEEAALRPRDVNVVVPLRAQKSSE